MCAEIINNPIGRARQPLDTAMFSPESKGVVNVYDGHGNQYESFDLNKRKSFVIAGALGKHRLLITDKNGNATDDLTFLVDCQTEINDSGFYQKLLNNLYWTMHANKFLKDAIVNGKVYHFFVMWLRDHVHTLKGMKYFDSNIRSAIELYRDTQRADGMIFDNIYPRNPHPNYFDMTFGKDGFILQLENGSKEMKRIPVENDVEYLYVEGIYKTWKATGDDAWMKGFIDSAIKAMEYSRTDPLRWSKKYKLLKRGHTIDTWDFQHSDDAKRIGTDFFMLIDKDKTEFGIMHGDNTGYAMACKQLAEMLEYTGKKKEAQKYRELEQDIRRRLDKLAWNGRFFTHHVPENKRIKRNIGVDAGKQVSLSNSYAINRDITSQQIDAIIGTYQRIAKVMPKTSAGEYYMIYPPFEHGYDHQGPKWDYMNGGVSSIVAGELAHGAFGHGHESYGVKILQRMHEWTIGRNGYLPCGMRGAMPEKPKCKFTILDIKNLVNADTSGTKGAEISWTGEGENDLHELPAGKQKYFDVPFNLINPAQNKRKVCIAIGRNGKAVTTKNIIINKKADSVYLLHAMHGKGIAGTMTWQYADGTSETQYVKSDKHIGSWWMPMDQSDLDTGKEGCPVKRRKISYRVAWRGKNQVCPNVGNYIAGFDNPQPKKKISSVALTAGHDGATWFVFAVTTCDKPVWFPISQQSYGIPDAWGAAAVVYALLEGLAGTKPDAVDETISLSPRWEAANVKDVTVCTKLPVSNTYVRYRYRKVGKHKIKLTIATDSNSINVDLLLPFGSKVASLKSGKEDINFSIAKVKKSRYCCFNLNAKKIHKITLGLIAIS